MSILHDTIPDEPFKQENFKIHMNYGRHIIVDGLTYMDYGIHEAGHTYYVTCLHNGKQVAYFQLLNNAKEFVLQAISNNLTGEDWWYEPGSYQKVKQLIREIKT